MTINTKTCLMLLTCFSISISGASHATLPTFHCTLTKQLDIYNWPGVSEETFHHTAPQLFFICDSDNVANGDTIKAVWIAENTINSVTANLTVGVKSSRYVKRLNGGEAFEANLSLTKPLHGWKVGNYNVQVYINGIPGENYKFQIR